ncbi:diacylglycerol kinase [Megalodesulfovibrio gigas]|uniref:Putative diacylglycerol kinase n=1 Tax=Megalodesulfovibrio gigas (strain ATCC 19364 / DSM 1382 / NCIMB 9332 / VKM B-1759) TaxID=1121448 RepID=T2GEF3_MEGG1|nr:diacylglycerol kinase [Megalodesulfovibrio gigas]AGW14980.1 putative diacylglycerol kinase [Megalodesulfovibrio gigas DSM 1382 = ATCC 19364]
MRNKFLGTGQPGYHPLRKIRICLHGLALAMRYDFSVAYKLALSAVVLAVALLMRDTVDVLLVAVATAQMLMAEIFNSALEAVCDYLTAREDRRVAAIKDMAAAAAGLSIAAWVAVLVGEVVLAFM